MRYKKIPARARGGFETHFSPVRPHDHWICEYWNPTQQRWIQVDAEIDSDLKQKWNFVLSEMILDVMALNKFELLPWDTNKLSEKHIGQLSESDLALLDKVAHLIDEGDKAFPEIRRHYETKPSLRMSWYWRP
jgi:hypothetical protein